MKKFNFLIVAILTAFNLNAQELIPNGGFEEGIDGWGVSIPANGGDAYLTTTRYTGLLGLGMRSPEGTGNVRVYLEEEINVIPDQQYILRYWFDDSSNYAKFRHWASFRDINGLEINYALDQLQPDFFDNTADGWEEVIITLIAPENATKFRLDFRTYEGDNLGGGNIYLDEVSFKAGNMSVSDLNASKVSMTSVWNNKANFNTKGNATVEIFNLNGQLIQKANGSNNFEVNVSKLTKGVYAVKVTVDGVVTTQKVVKK